MNRRKFLLGSAALPALGGALHSRDPELPPELPQAPVDPHDETYWHGLRWHFAIPHDEVYCNSATLGASPKVVVHAIHDHMLHSERMLSSSFYGTEKPTFLGGYEDEPALRTRVGKLLGCSMEETALTRNATMGMSYIAMGLRLQKGDEVVMTDQEHAGGRSAYDVRVKRDGIKIVEATIDLPPNDPDRIVRAIAESITKRTKVVAVPHITSALGLILPVKRIVQMVREKNRDIFVVLDGAQALGHVPVDVEEFGCDAYFSSPHKWLLAPKGTGVLYVKKESNERVWTTIASGQWDFREDVGRRFSHTGTGNQSLHKGFEAGLDFLDRIGMDVIHKRIKALGDRLRKGLAAIDGVTITSSTHDAMCAGITSYTIRGWDGKRAEAHMFATDKIMPRAVGEGLRQSLHIYTTFADVDQTLARLRQMLAEGTRR